MRILTSGRASALVTTLVLLAAACSSGQDPIVGPGVTAAGPADTAAPATPADPAAPDQEPPARGGDQPAEGPAPAPGPAPTGAAGAPDAPPSEPAPRGSGRVGSYGPVLLRAEPARRVILRILTAPGAEPRRETLDHLVAVLGDVTGKPVSTTGGADPGTRDIWSGDDLRAAADAAGGTTPDDAAVLHLLFVGGRSSEGDGVLGVAVRGDVAAVFTEQVRSAASPLVGPGAIEAAVTVHEVGHLLGLVDLVVSTGRADPEHPGHSPNRGSVMYWAVESSLVTDVLTGGPPRHFDADDRAELERIRSQG